MRYLSIILAFILGLGAAFAQRSMGSPVSMQVSAANVAVGEVFQVTYTIVSDPGDTPSVKVPKIKGCTQLEMAGPYSERRFMDFWGGNNVTDITRYVFSYRADRRGQCDIQPATVEIGDRKYKSQSTTINVEDGDDLVPVGDDIFLKLELSALHAETGEPVTLSVVLYSRFKIDKFKAYETPSAKNCTIDRVPARAERLPDERINGEIYGVWVLERYVVTPSSTGKIKFEPGIFGISPDYRGMTDPFFSFGPSIQREFAYVPSTVVLDVVKEGQKKRVPHNPGNSEPRHNDEPADDNLIFVMSDDSNTTFHFLHSES